MSQIKLNAIAAICNENNGIGKDNALPWSIPEDYNYFLRVASSTADNGKINCLIMGRLTWLSLTKEHGPIGKSLHIIISNKMKPNDIEFGDETLNKNILILNSVSEAIDLVRNKYSDQIETIYVCGGSSIYNSIVERDDFHRFYLTRVLDYFECNVFIKSNFLANFTKITDESLDKESKMFKIDYNVVKTDKTNGAKFIFEVYEKQKN
jgi:dihydrofolate reductase